MNEHRLDDPLLEHLDDLGARDTAVAWRASAGPSITDLRDTVRERQRARRQRRRLGTGLGAAAIFVAGTIVGASWFASDSSVAVTAGAAPPADGAVAVELTPEDTAPNDTAPNDTASHGTAPEDTEGEDAALTVPTCAVGDELTLTVSQPGLSSSAYSARWADHDGVLTAEVATGELLITFTRPGTIGEADWRRPIGWPKPRGADGVDVMLPNDHPSAGLSLQVSSNVAACDSTAVRIQEQNAPGSAPLADFGWYVDRTDNPSHSAHRPGRYFFSTAPLVIDANRPAAMSPTDVASCAVRVGESHLHPNLIASTPASGPETAHVSAVDALRATLAADDRLPNGGYDRFVIDDETIVFARPIGGAEIPEDADVNVAPPEPFALQPRSVAVYRAQANDTLASVADQFATTSEVLVSTNPGISTGALTPGQIVRFTLTDLSSSGLNTNGDNYETVVVVVRSGDEWFPHSQTWRDC